jgi:hypothetical protein
MTIIAPSARRPVSHAFAVPVVREQPRPVGAAGGSAW